MKDLKAQTGGTEMGEMITQAETYDYPPSGLGSDTRATLIDGRIVTVNIRDEAVLPKGDHADNCDQINKMGGRCTCGLLDGIDVQALVADARERGRFGQPNAPKRTTSDSALSQIPGLCPRCGTVCYGDCRQ